MHTRQSRVDELKQSIDRLVHDLLQNLKDGQIENGNAMLMYLNQLIFEMRSHYASEPQKVKDYLNYFMQYEQQIRESLIENQKNLIHALANMERMKQDFGLESKNNHEPSVTA